MTWIFDKKETITAEGASVSWIDHRYFTLEFEGRIYHGEIVSDDSESQELMIKINQRQFHVRKQHELDELIHQLGLDKPKHRKIKSYVAPMPGRILKIHVKIGDLVEPGMPLLSLEAMKMENTLKSNGLGVVKALHIKEGDVVEKGVTMLEFD
jgi:biotin carboxyl carrier protein